MKSIAAIAASSLAMLIGAAPTAACQTRFADFRHVFAVEHAPDGTGLYPVTGLQDMLETPFSVGECDRVRGRIYFEDSQFAVVNNEMGMRITLFSNSGLNELITITGELDFIHAEILGGGQDLPSSARIDRIEIRPTAGSYRYELGPAHFQGIEFDFNIDNAVSVHTFDRIAFDLRGDDAELSFVDSIPEPGTWASMLLGFGAIGAIGRRARLRTA